MPDARVSWHEKVIELVRLVSNLFPAFEYYCISLFVNVIQFTNLFIICIFICRPFEIYMTCIALHFGASGFCRVYYLQAILPTSVF